MAAPLGPVHSHPTDFCCGILQLGRNIKEHNRILVSNGLPIRPYFGGIQRPFKSSTRGSLDAPVYRLCRITFLDYQGGCCPGNGSDALNKCPSGFGPGIYYIGACCRITDSALTRWWPPGSLGGIGGKQTRWH